MEIPKVWKTGNLVCKTVDKLCICFKSNISEKNELISFYKLNVVFSRIKRKSSQITRKISIKTGQFVIKNRSYTMPAAFTNNNKKYDYEKKRTAATKLLIARPIVVCRYQHQIGGVYIIL